MMKTCGRAALVVAGLAVFITWPAVTWTVYALCGVVVTFYVAFTNERRGGQSLTESIKAALIDDLVDLWRLCWRQSGLGALVIAPTVVALIVLVFWPVVWMDRVAAPPV